MTIDAQVIINALFGVATTIFLGLGGFLGRHVWEAIQMLRDRIHKVEVDLPTNYMQKLEFNDRMDRVDQMLQRISDKLDNKADKSDLSKK